MQTEVDRFLRNNKRLNDADNYNDMKSLYRALDMDEYDIVYGIDTTEFKMHDPLLIMREAVRKGAYSKMRQGKINIIYECPCKKEKKHNHHFNYDRPLEVMRLCVSCHKKEHSRLNAQSDLSDSDSLAIHEQPKGRDLVEREDCNQDSATSYQESVPCAGDDGQTVTLTAVCESGKVTPIQHDKQGCNHGVSQY